MLPRGCNPKNGLRFALKPCQMSGSSILPKGHLFRRYKLFKRFSLKEIRMDSTSEELNFATTTQIGMQKPFVGFLYHIDPGTPGA